MKNQVVLKVADLLFNFPFHFVCSSFSLRWGLGVFF